MVSLKKEFINDILLYLILILAIFNIYETTFLNNTKLLVLSILTTVLLIVFIVLHYKNIKRYKLLNSIYDIDTKLYNKQYFMVELENNLTRSHRYDLPLSILSLKLKNLNTLDHKNKKLFLKQLGAELINSTRSSDISCRYDEETIIILLPMTDYLHASLAKDRISNIVCRLENDSMYTIMFEINIIEPVYEESLRELLSRI